MCLIAAAIDAHPRWRFVLAGNRDEFHARPTAPAAVIDDVRGHVGGRDLVAGGGWLQADHHGRVAAVTNVRLQPAPAGERSRGGLVAGFVGGSMGAEAFLDALVPASMAYGRFNLLLWDGQGHHASNHPGPRRQRLGAGVHGLSNADLGTPWPKTMALADALSAWLGRRDGRDPWAAEVVAPLFEALADPREADDSDLPCTGIALDWERRLSAAFIVGEDYGTRASSVVLVGDDGLWFEERRFGPDGRADGRSTVWLPRPV